MKIRDLLTELRDLPPTAILHLSFEADRSTLLPVAELAVNDWHGPHPGTSPHFVSLTAASDSEQPERPLSWLLDALAEVDREARLYGGWDGAVSWEVTGLLPGNNLIAFRCAGSGPHSEAVDIPEDFDGDVQQLINRRQRGEAAGS